MEKEIDYIVLSYGNTKLLVEEVNKQLLEGYVLVGGVSVSTVRQINGDIRYTFAQAMCKHV